MACAESKLPAAASQALKVALGVEVSSPSCDAALSALVQPRVAVSTSFTAALKTVGDKMGLQVGTAPRRVRAGGRPAACQGVVDMHLVNSHATAQGVACVTPRRPAALAAAGRESPSWPLLANTATRARCEYA